MHQPWTPGRKSQWRGADEGFGAAKEKQNQKRKKVEEEIKKWKAHKKRLRRLSKRMQAKYCGRDGKTENAFISSGSDERRWYLDVMEKIAGREREFTWTKDKNGKKETGQPRVQHQERPSRETETREITCLPRMMVQQCCPGNAAARIMSWLVLVHLKAASQLSCLQPGVSRLPGTRSDELTRTNGCTEFQYTQASRGCPLHSQYFFLSTSQSLALCLTLCVWCGKVLILGLIFACSSAHTPFSTSTLSAITVNQSRSGYLQLTLNGHPPPLVPDNQPRSLSVTNTHTSTSPLTKND